MDKNTFEGFGLVYLEANIKGVPCLGSKYSGAQEAIYNGVSGYIVDPYNKKEVAQKIDLILNKNKIKSQDCVAFAKNNSAQKKSQEIINLYKSLL